MNSEVTGRALQGRMLAGYRMTLVSSDDGTGDAFLEIPSRILRDLGWGVGDSLQIHAGDDGTLVLHHMP